MERCVVEFQFADALAQFFEFAAVRGEEGAEDHGNGRVEARERFRRRTLEKSARFRIDDLADEVIGAGVANIELDGFIEFDEFEQISLTFVG